ncbi:hypothetical protein QBC37DRAFT_370686 [Rhypophila decipiens]|uniref:Uncharacterized protein n=1 Tax=Rhypophila decipiens TaxID=261697 RepID=A0AAN6YCG1_9PEZI|nr:hypothetical protein QBC37DRAFT_370686 [Rhypophila decipiens]
MIFWPPLSRASKRRLVRWLPTALIAWSFIDALRTSDVHNIINTNSGRYAAACSLELDFSKPPRYYDTFALSDAEGHETAT